MADIILTYLVAYLVVWMGASSWSETGLGTVGAWSILAILQLTSS